MKNIAKVNEGGIEALWRHPITGSKNGANHRNAGKKVAIEYEKEI